MPSASNNLASAVWRQLRKYSPSVAKLVVGAIIGGFFMQVIPPTVIPQFEIALFDTLGISLQPATFRVIADEREYKPTANGQPGKELLAFHRVFCGYSLTSPIRYCLQRTVSPQYGTDPAGWPLAPHTDTKVMMVGHTSDDMTASFIDKDTQSVGIMRLFRSAIPNHYTGFGFGCYRVENSTRPIWGRYLIHFGDLKTVLIEFRGNAELAKIETERAFQELFDNIIAERGRDENVIVSRATAVQPSSSSSAIQSSLCVGPLVQAKN